MFDINAAFLEACEKGDLDFVSKVNKTYVSYQLGLALAVEYHQNHVAEWLLENGADVNYLKGELLNIARHANNSAMAKLFELKRRSFKIDPISGKASYKPL